MSDSHVRKPNRRPIPGLAELVNGGLCAATRKVRYLDERTARRALAQIARRDPDAETLDVYRCRGRRGCGDWHVGHRVVPRGTG